MRLLSCLAILTLLSAPRLTSAADPVAKLPIAAELLLGTWTVDLRPTPSSPAYLKKLIITSVTDGNLEGSFYDGSPLQAGRTNNTSTDALCFAFFTDPGEGAYQSSGRLITPDTLEGMTLSTTRHFLLPWHATRDKPENAKP